MTYITLLVILILISGCGSCDSSAPVSSSLESILASNSQWPFEVLGILDIVEAGGYGVFEYPDWAVGSLNTSDDPEGILIDIGSGVVASSSNDIDSGESMRVWLEQPTKQYGMLSYPITKMIIE